MYKPLFGLLIFVAGVSLGWYAQQHGESHPPDSGGPVAWLPAAPQQQESVADHPATPPRDSVADLVYLLEQDAFGAAVQLYEALQTGADEAAVERGREQILSRARALLGAGRFDRAEQLLQHYLLAAYRDVEARMLLADAYAGRNAFRGAVDQLYEARGYAWQPDSLERLTRRIRAVVAAQVKALQAAGDRHGLLEFYQHLTQLEPAYAAYFLGLADAQLALDDSAAARRSLQLVLQDPEIGSQARARLDELSRAELPVADAEASAALPQVLGVPLHRSGNHFLVDARVAGAGSVRLLIDTGASMTILTPGALAGSGSGYTDTGSTRVFSTANGKVKAPVYRLEALEVGDWQVSELDIGVLELDGNPRIDGLLGMNFLRHFQFFIDQNEALLRLSLDKP